MVSETVTSTTPSPPTAHRSSHAPFSAATSPATAHASGSARTALPAAAALELLHTAFLIHDDVEDHSRLRRGRPTLHELHGSALAINAGDALANLAVRPLTSPAFPRYRAREVLAELRLAIRQTTEGQALELGWRRHGVVDLSALDLYLRKGSTKTGFDALDSNQNGFLDDGDKYVSIAAGNTVIDLGAAQLRTSGVDLVTVMGMTGLNEADFLL